MRVQGTVNDSADNDLKSFRSKQKELSVVHECVM